MEIKLTKLVYTCSEEHDTLIFICIILMMCSYRALFFILLKCHSSLSTLIREEHPQNPVLPQLYPSPQLAFFPSCLSKSTTSPSLRPVFFPISSPHHQPPQGPCTSKLSKPSTHKWVHLSPIFKAQQKTCSHCLCPVSLQS
jgi:hypothetical protein